MRRVLTERGDRVFWACLLLLLVVFTVWQFLHLGGYRWDWDEGVYALTARSMVEGNRLYADIFCTAPPLFIASLKLGFQVAGDTIPVGRAVVVLYSALGLLGAGLLAREGGGRLAGLVAVIVLAVAPHFYILSRVIIADMPSLGLSCLALWMGVRYGRTGHRRWLVASGLTLAWGLLIKLTAGLVVPVIVALVLMRDLDGAWRKRSELVPALRRVGTSVLILGASVLVPLAACLVLYPWHLLLDQVVSWLWTQQETFVPDWTANVETVFKYLVLDNFNIALNRGLTMLGFAGGIALFFRSCKDALIWWLWLLIVLVVLVNYAPLWPHLLSPALFPLAVGAGVAAGALYRLIREGRHAGWTVGRMALVGLLAVALLAYVYDWPRIVTENGRRDRAPGGSAFKSAVEFVEQHTAPDDYVITDEPLLAFYADRRVPPNLIDCSIVRIAIGRLTDADLIRETESRSPSAIVLWKDGRFSTYLSDYVAWFESRYTLGWERGKGERIYLVPEVTESR